uniref:Uncharacterized protein n=1 Tax=Solanum tuberosum TaxID=4113 RepID=M1DC01_SOLTU
MDKTGVHSPTNVEKAIVSAKGTASPGQTVTEPADSEPSEPEDTSTRSRSDEDDPSIDHFTQNYDPNNDDDSGMSFDSEALHNLDT